MSVDLLFKIATLLEKNTQQGKTRTAEVRL